MITKTRIARLTQLSAKADQLIEFRSTDDDDQRGSVAGSIAKGLGVAGIGTAGLAGYGALQMRGDMLNAKGGQPLGSGWNAAKTGGADYLQRAKVYAGSAGTAVKGSLKNLTDLRGMGVSTGAALKSAGGNLLSRLKGLRLSARAERLIQLNAKVDELLQFESPMATFNRGHAAIMQAKRDEYLKAKQAKKDASRGLQDADWGLTDAHEVLRENLNKESYARRGAGIGAGVGALTGAAIGISAGRKHGAKALGGVLGGAHGAIFGGWGGTEVGGRIRRKEPLTTA